MCLLFFICFSWKNQEIWRSFKQLIYFFFSPLAVGTCQKSNSHQRPFFKDDFLAGKLFFHNKNVEKPYKIKVLSQKVFIQNLTPLFIFWGIPCRELEIQGVIFVFLWFFYGLSSFFLILDETQS